MKRDAINKENNSLFKVTNEDTNYNHIFTSIGKASDVLGIGRTAVENAYLKNRKTKGYKIELIDGAEIRWKDIN